MNKSTTATGGRCYHSHPALPVGGGKVIYGGSCSVPGVTDATIYVGLDGSHVDPVASYPWNGTVTSVYFQITDGSPPKNEAEFSKMVAWLSDRLDAGEKVHVGCIGGHGRTGTLLSALVAHRSKKYPELGDDPIQYVRDNYCKKAVESKSQVDFLVSKFSCKEAAPSRSANWGKGGAGNFDGIYDMSASQGSFYGKNVKHGGGQKSLFNSEKPGHYTPQKTATISSGTPVRNTGTIWAKSVSSKV